MLKEKKKKEGRLSKFFLGALVGGAVASVLGVTFSDKERREKIKTQGVKAWKNSKKFLHDKTSFLPQCKKKPKETFWHFLNRCFYSKGSLKENKKNK